MNGFFLLMALKEKGKRGEEISISLRPASMTATCEASRVDLDRCNSLDPSDDSWKLYRVTQLTPL